MFCKYCGKEIVEGSKFCEECGKEIVLPEETASEPEVKEEVATPEQPEEVTAQEEPTQETAETPAEESVSEEAPVEVVAEETVAEPVFAEPQFDAPVKKRKKKKALAILIPVIAVLVAAAIVAALFLDPVKGFFIKTFGSDEDYFEFVETKAFTSGTDDISKIYGSLFNALNNSDAAAESSLELNVSDQVINLLEELLEEETGETTDLDWLDTVKFDVNVNTKNQITQEMLAININGKELISADYIMDMNKGEVFIALSSLTDGYLKSEIASNEETQKILEILKDEELRKNLPSQDKFDKLLDKYIKVIFENIDDVEKSSEKVEIGDIKEKLTVLEAEIDMEDAQDILLAVLKTAKKDEELKKYIKDVAKYLEKQEIISDSSRVYNDFKDFIDEEIEAIEGSEIEDDDSAIVWTDYVNSKHEIVGRKLEFDKREIFYYTLVRDGNKFAYELEYQGIELSGEGTEKKDVVNAEYTVKYEDDEICDIEVIDYKTNSDYLNGKIRISPSEKVLEEIEDLDSDIASALTIVNPTLELNFENSEKSSKFEINIVSGEEVLVGLTATGKETKPSKVETPDSNEVYEEDEAEEWASNIDAQKLLDKLEEIGVSTDFIESLINSYYDDYYDDYDDYYNDDYYDYYY